MALCLFFFIYLEGLFLSLSWVKVEGLIENKAPGCTGVTFCLCSSGPQMASAKESLPHCDSYKWEENVHCVVSQLFEPAGFRLRALSRVPYLSEGDLSTPYYTLDEALLLLERAT